ncbi:MAG: ribosome biogenesis GTPase Der, partial [Candidatus Heimdallarchaeota archaeon]|nr:ribosome biogenesis GTPase Der [Candidatus Heimdallarchaeota archaeon]
IIDNQDLSEHVEQQIAVALESADLLLFVVDAMEGIRALDKRICTKLRKIDKPKILVINKADNPKIEAEATEFYEFGFEDIVTISVIGRRNIGDLRDKIAEYIEKMPMSEENDNAEDLSILRISMLGRRNVGKSSLVNALAGEERVIVSEIEGTTRYAVDVKFMYEGKKFVAIDTAGLRRKSAVENTFEFYSQARALGTIKHSDVILLMFDVRNEISDLEKKLAARTVESVKPAIIVINKWDLALEEGLTVEEYEKYLRDRLPGLAFAPISFISVKNKLNLWETINLAQDLWHQTNQRINTGELNRIVNHAIQVRKPPRLGTRNAKIYYSTQISVAPPSVVIFVNDPNMFPNDYKRFLVNQLRESSPFPEVPIRIIFRKRQHDEET